MLIYSLILFAVGLVLLLKGSNLLVDNAVKLSKAFGISEFVIGVSLIATGTSLPEFFVASIASLTNNSSIALGDIVGANISNIALNLGISASIAAIYIKRKIFDQQCFVVFGSAVLMYALSVDGVISMLDGIILLATFIYYVLFLFKYIKHLEDVFKLHSYAGLFFSDNAKNGNKHLKLPVEKDLMYAVASIISILFGAYLLVNGAAGLANDFNLHSSIIGLTLVALSTSAPELAVSMQAIRKARYNILLGNILGSNITNILLVIGFAALLNPLHIPKNILDYSMPFMLIITTILLVFAYLDLKISRREGLLLVALYFAAVYFSVVGTAIA